MAGQRRANITVSIKLWPLTPDPGISQSARQQVTSYILIGGLHNQASYLSYLKWNELDSWSEPRLIWHRARRETAGPGKVGAKVGGMHQMLHPVHCAPLQYFSNLCTFLWSLTGVTIGRILIKILGNSGHSSKTENICNEAWQMSPGLSFFRRPRTRIVIL